MSLHHVELDLAPDACELAKKIAHRPGAVWLWSNAARPHAYLASDPIDSVAHLDPEPGLTLNARLGANHAVPRWVGLLPYETFRRLERPKSASLRDRRSEPLIVEPRWWRYGAVVEVTDRVKVVGDNADCVSALVAHLEGDGGAPQHAAVELMAHSEDASTHEARVRIALDHIQAGDIYQVNLARRFELQVSGLALDWLGRLGQRAPAPFGFALQTDTLRIAGTSPELCLSLDATGRLLTCPIKGTRPRGASVAEDKNTIEALATDPKEIAELSMVIDLERNDLNRVAQPGSVIVLGTGAIETYGPVHQRVAAVTASLRSGISRTTLLEAFLPSGSVTGAPKIRAMELIAALESSRRGLYTGAYGWLGHDGSMRLAMAIRTLVANSHGRGHYFAGGGIVADSDPHKEVEETLWKSVQLLDISSLVRASLHPNESLGASAENWAYTD